MQKSFKFYGYNEFTFTSCGVQGSHGPYLNECINHYNVTWVKDVNNYSMWSPDGKPLVSRRYWMGEKIYADESHYATGIQKITIPISANYEITAYGAGRLNYGAMAKAVVELKEGTEILIAVGQQGIYDSDGSGGTFLAMLQNNDIIPLIIAGGSGGGDRSEEYSDGSTNIYGGRSDTIKDPNDQVSERGLGQAGFKYRPNNGVRYRCERDSCERFRDLYEDYICFFCNNAGSGFNRSKSVRYQNDMFNFVNHKDDMENPAKSFIDGLEGAHYCPPYVLNVLSEGGYGGGSCRGAGGGYTGGNGGKHASGGGGSLVPHNGLVKKGHKGPGFLKLKII